MTKASHEKTPQKNNSKKKQKNGFASKEAAALTEFSSLRDWCANVLQCAVLVTHNCFICAKMPKLT